ncbi:hypothetical protein OJF2_69920 [Aquisphaera giovannonii]|uniref:Uncharacterized protein n=1 Tax=Aquisphaera giovannonii TaxID=406548 RepID=A0A5B9WEL2_9BACT|nr:hypothetical protein [Aquisphaera giovannonii]QEH38391.1 hypothetical protein OJF2_69920 [Aquisphaera giovannonii]
MRSLGEDAEALRLGLVMGLHQPRDVVAWADGVIEAMESPPIEIIEIALAKDRPADELSRLLQRVAGPNDMAMAAHRTLHILRASASGGMPLATLIDILLIYSTQARIPEAERKAAAELGALYDDLEYWGTPENLADEVRAFLDRYASGSGGERNS